MVTLTNLIKSNGIISADYFLENNNSDIGHIDYDMEHNRVVKYLYSKEDKQSHIKYGFNKSIKAIELLIKYNKFPKTYHYMWY